MALASLLAQTYANWECVFVDDGSTDHPERFVAAAGTARIRYMRLERNMGRSFARQRTLDEARGDFVTMLDADDWMHPQKLEKQVNIMTSHPELTVVSTAMAIVDRNCHIVGVRGFGRLRPRSMICGRVSKPWLPPIPFAPAMIRAGIAKQSSFDVSFSRGEDAEFLLKVLEGGRLYAVLPDALYVYSEYESESLAKILASASTIREVCMRNLPAFPVSSRARVIEASAKVALYRVLHGLGLWDFALALRSAKPTEDDRQRFAVAVQAVKVATQRMFPEGLSPSIAYDDAI
jgi:glycosyltransferase involved in cell wall biosynthesis